MKYILLIALFVTSLTAFADNQQTGVGFMLGNPTGLTGKHWLSDTQAVDAAAGMSIGEHSNFSIHSDYLFHSKEAFFFNDVNPLDLYYGIGGRMEFADDIELGLRVPVGLVHQFKENNADVFAEVAPILDFMGRTGLEIHLAVGARYYY